MDSAAVEDHFVAVLSDGHPHLLQKRQHGLDISQMRHIGQFDIVGCQQTGA